AVKQQATPLPNPQNVSIESKFYVEKGEVKIGPVTALAETIQLDPGSQINGGAALVGSTVTIDGQINGDLTAIGSTITIGEGAEINGSATLTGKTIVINDPAEINGNLTVTGEDISISPRAEINGGVSQCVATFDSKLLKSLPDGPPAPCPQSASAQTQK